MLPLHFTHFRLLLVSLNPPLLTVCSVSRSRWFLLFSLDDTHTHTHTHTCVEYFWQLSVWSPLEMSELLGQADLWASAASWKNWKRKKKGSNETPKILWIIQHHHIKVDTTNKESLKNSTQTALKDYVSSQSSPVGPVNSLLAAAKEKTSRKLHKLHLFQV